MTALDARESLLLPESAAAAEAGVTVETLRNWAATGLLKPVHEPCYEMAAIRALIERARSIPPPSRRPEYLSPWQAADLLGVGVPTLTRKAGQGCVEFIRTPEGHRRYEADAVRAIAAKRAEPGFETWWPEPQTT